MNVQEHQAGRHTAKQTILFILGAGCSIKHGYPSAIEMVEHLKLFCDTLDKASRLYNLVEQTIDLFERLRATGAPAQTLDDLAWLVHQGKIPAPKGTSQDDRDERLVDEAKTAVAALFLSKEADAVRGGLHAYRNLLRRVFASDYGTDYRAAMRNTPYRVLTFNYDRLFELAFRQHFQVDLTEAFYGQSGLNSGLYPVRPQDVDVDLNRFSFLKLHGSVGLYSFERHGNCDHRHSIPDPTQAPPITDDEFFYPTDHPRHRNQAKPPLIVFPHEKEFLIQYRNNWLPYRVYIPKIWNAADHFACQAKEIWFIGYSCPEPDFSAWRSLIESAQNCERIVIQNLCAKSICERLKIRLPEKAHLFHAYERSFEES